MTFKADERIYETSTTVGTGTYALAGAQVGYQAFSVLSAGNDCPYFATDDTDWEVGIGSVLSGPNRLQRTAVLASSNGGAAVNWSAGTRKIRCAWPAWVALPRYKTKSVAGAVGTTVLTQDEQRAHVLEFTGALTGNRIIEVDATPWRSVMYNNTTGAFSVTIRVTGQTGFILQRGRRMAVTCDGTDVRADAVYRKAADVVAAGTIDLNVDGDLVDVTGSTGITAVTLEEGREVTVRFTGTPALTNGASLVLRKGISRTAVAGEYMVFRGYASGVVREVSAGPAKQPTVTVLTSGSGTYNTPSGATRIKSRLVGPGGGGGGSGTSGQTSGGTGTNTTFSTLSANAGTGGASSGGAAGAAATASGGDLNINGQAPGPGASTAATMQGGSGASSQFGSGGPGGMPGTSGAATPTAPGAGGGGAQGSSASGVGAAAGGGSGAYVEKTITGPSSSYSYVVGTAGTAGGAGTSGAGGGAGGPGLIIIEEFYD